MATVSDGRSSPVLPYRVDRHVPEPQRRVVPRLELARASGRYGTCRNEQAVTMKSTAVPASTPKRPRFPIYEPSFRTIRDCLLGWSCWLVPLLSECRSAHLRRTSSDLSGWGTLLSDRGRAAAAPSCIGSSGEEQRRPTRAASDRSPSPFHPTSREKKRTPSDHDRDRRVPPPPSGGFPGPQTGDG